MRLSTDLYTCLLNRHYVTPALKQQMFDIAKEMDRIFPGTRVNYLDANFPFLDGFPLIPHLSHNDGHKLDLAFYYKDRDTGQQINDSPSWIGYGIFEGPKAGEVNYPKKCRDQGYWQYSAISFVVPGWSKDKYEVDEVRTRALVKFLLEHKRTSKVFIEPHLKERWGLNGYSKIRFQGCHSVRHDDHIHMQVY